VAFILSLETATDICSVALSDSYDNIVAHRTLEPGKRHSQLLTSLIKDVLSDAAVSMSDLSAVALSDGPGSYTGLRVGASTAKALCYGLDIPLISIPTLDALAVGHTRDQNNYIMSTIDARRMEVYASVYKHSRQLTDVHSIIWSEEAIQKLIHDYEPLTICGDGVAKAKDLFRDYPQVRIAPSKCSASDLAPLAHEKFDAKVFADLAYHDPFYFKSPNITTSKKKFL